jgi:hypothetical protein
MVVAWRFLTAWSVQNSGSFFIPTIGSRPRRLAGVPEEAPADAKMPPAMEVLRFAPAAASVSPAVADNPVSVTAPLASPAIETDIAPEMAEEPEAPFGEGELAASGVLLTEIFQSGAEIAEHVVIVNSGPNPVVLEGWRLTDEGEQHAYEFGSLVLVSQATLRVYMRAGENTDTDLYVGEDLRWWNNTGDTAYLYDAAGDLVHALTYVEESER